MSIISDAISTALPWLTTAITSGPAGLAAMAAGKIAGVLGLGDKTVDAVKSALSTITLTAEQQLSLQKEEHEFQLQMRQMGFTAYKQLRADDNETLNIVNGTMRVEEALSNWYAADWRPTWGYVSAAMFAYVCIVAGALGIIAVINRDVQILDFVTKFVMAFIPLFAIACAVLGVQAWKDGNADQILAQLFGRSKD